jgi:hypothetical protein
VLVVNNGEPDESREWASEIHARFRWHCAVRPVFLFPSVHQAVIGSVIVTLLPLLSYGYISDTITSARRFRNASKTALVFELATTAAFVPQWPLA